MTNFEQLIKAVNREHVYIQTHNFPDPDAIASAYGLQRLLAARGLRSTICYKGKIDRYSTGKLVEIIGIELLNVDELENVLSDEDEVILVDSQKGNSNIIDITGDEIICVDHHPCNDMFEYRFKDIRPEVGACATMIAQYFYENHVPVDQKIATALTYGIRIDTNNLTRGVSKLDIEMLYRMFDACDYGIISMLENSMLCFADLVAYSKAISNIEVCEEISFADTGIDCPVIADISDFMLALKEVAFSVVYSAKDGGIKLSVRSKRSALDAGKIISRALEGIGNGGGHASMAGGFVPFEGGAAEKAALVADIRKRFVTVIREWGEKTMETFCHMLENREMKTDYLTGLCDRRGLGEIWQSLAEDMMVHCLYIDVDNFKLVNDIYGHAKGDALLVFVSVLLNETFHGQLVVRMGGDEFVVLCDGQIARGEIEERLFTIQERLRRGDFDVNIDKFLSFSIGVSYSQPVRAGLHVILEQADVAMYQVKKSGKGHFVVYEEIRVQIEEEKRIKERAFRGEIWHELRLLYRPVVYIQTSDIYAVETVLQWDFPEKGVFSEEKFMPVLKQYSIDIQLGRYVLETVCAQKQRWRNTEFDKIEFYVRLTSRFLLQKDSIAVIADCMEKYHVGYGELQICIEENDFGEKGEKLYAAAQKLLDMGFKVAINNFASSSLYVLQRLPSQLLKLDAKLLAKTQYNKKSVYILRNVISLGRDLECGIVAQGIENTAQVKMLASYGAQFGVGDFYGMPCDESTFFERYRDRLFLTHNLRPTCFQFARQLTDEKGEYTGVFTGEEMAYTTGVYEGQSALCFPGGKVGENCVRLPREVMYSDSYSICFWVKPDRAQPWSSVVYITYMDGFMSLMPNSGHGDLFFRIKDDREPDEWHDLICRPAVPGQWSYICVTFDVITHIGKLYFNGLMVGSMENMPDLKVADQILLGGDEYQDSFAGKLAGFEIYHYAVSAEVIEEKFKAYQRMPSYEGPDGRK